MIGSSRQSIRGIRDVRGTRGTRENITERPTEPLSEKTVTGIVERQTARVPSLTFLNLAIVSMVASLGVVIFARRKELGNFIGMWAPSFLLLGIYNKLLRIEEEQKTHISERSSA